jgi:hypothetical protein
VLMTERRRFGELPLEFVDGLLVRVGPARYRQDRRRLAR